MQIEVDGAFQAVMTVTFLNLPEQKLGQDLRLGVCQSRRIQAVAG
jgi:hypothetical protein